MINKRKIIIDTDPGIDDAIAIIAAMKYPGFEILGITSVAGNKGIEFTTDNACKIVEYMNYDCKVYQGAYSNYVTVKAELPANHQDGGDVHGKDGLGGANLKAAPQRLSSMSAVEFIIESVKKYPGEVEIITIGPMTNIAFAIEHDREAMKKVKAIHSMGGGVFQGNMTPVAEFNYWFDPEAVEIVYSIGEEVPITMVGLDATHQCKVDINDLTFMNLAGGDLGELIHRMTSDYVDAYWRQNKIIGIVIHDLVAVIGAIYPEIYTKVVFSNLRVATEGLAKGQCIVDLVDSWKLPKNAYVVMGVDVHCFKQRFIELCFGQDILTLYDKVI